MAVSRLPHGLRLAAFRLLEWASLLRRPPAVSPAPPSGGPANAGRPSLWVYVTTIGELNAIDPFLRRLLQVMGQPPLTLVTNHAHYAPAYLRKFPEAVVECLDGSSPQVRALLRRRPPSMLLVAEIPCLLHDAPCRFSYATLYAVKRTGAPTVLVNGWLYGYSPASRMDALEQRWFARDYVRGFDLLLVQTPQVQARLLQAGADPDRLVVTGNLKFDAMRAAARDTARGPLGRRLADHRDGPVVVAGSVTETEEQRQMLAAFETLRRSSPGARLVLAPRHPENQPRMAALAGLLAQAGLAVQYRSQIEPAQALAAPVLVLDTMGELRDCYAAATLAYVGTDHNVLEPLAYGKPVYVSGHWEASYPSYPVYLQTLELKLIQAVDSIEALGPRWLADLPRLDTLQRDTLQALASLQADGLGSVERNIELVGARVLAPRGLRLA